MNMHHIELIRLIMLTRVIQMDGRFIGRLNLKFRPRYVFRVCSYKSKKLSMPLKTLTHLQRVTDSFTNSSDYNYKTSIRLYSSSKTRTRQDEAEALPSNTKGKMHDLRSTTSRSANNRGAFNMMKDDIY